jgi:regulator of protease activity HflC (stomatin/prohibitin superfamily)
MKPFLKRYQLSLAFALFRRWALLIELSAVVNDSLDVVALYRQVLGDQDKAQAKKRASQIHRVQNRNQDEEEQNCPDHKQGRRSRP